MRNPILFMLSVLVCSFPLVGGAKQQAISSKPDELVNRVKAIEETLKNVEQKKEADETRLKSVEESVKNTKEHEKFGEQITNLEERLTDVEKKIEVLGERENLLVARTMGIYKGSYYVRTGATVLFPRSSTFSKKTDTGLGVLVGIGKYVEEQHVAEAGINWELYPALALRYRFEWRNKSNTLNLGPILGFQVRLLDRDPLDKYLDPNEELKSVYGIIGIAAGHPIGLSILQTEVLAYFNQQFIVVGSVALHYVL